MKIICVAVSRSKQKKQFPFHLLLLLTLIVHSTLIEIFCIFFSLSLPFSACGNKTECEFSATMRNLFIWPKANHEKEKTDKRIKKKEKMYCLLKLFILLRVTTAYVCARIHNFDSQLCIGRMENMQYC